jgi:hypothetical protein
MLLPPLPVYPRLPAKAAAKQLSRCRRSCCNRFLKLQTPLLPGRTCCVPLLACHSPRCHPTVRRPHICTHLHNPTQSLVSAARHGQHRAFLRNVLNTAAVEQKQSCKIWPIEAQRQCKRCESIVLPCCPSQTAKRVQEMICPHTARADTPFRCGSPRRS